LGIGKHYMGIVYDAPIIFNPKSLAQNYNATISLPGKVPVFAAKNMDFMELHLFVLHDLHQMDL